ncbi:hypothetical protein C8F04DRAFT_1178195 [Mycena alexandri]|uniref:Uncharacterized protein n=1 Tax=Mycena alexandri TaxID=1745969 RepID=A0AAD6T732_9AGAR|nr:hypothetical protein C8F04DRAFT_1178195 [Mycena alexandri]
MPVIPQSRRTRTRHLRPYRVRQSSGFPSAPELEEDHVAWVFQTWYTSNDPWAALGAGRDTVTSANLTPSGSGWGPLPQVTSSWGTGDGWGAAGDTTGNTETGQSNSDAPWGSWGSSAWIPEGNYNETGTWITYGKISAEGSAPAGASTGSMQTTVTAVTAADPPTAAVPIDDRN